MTIMDRETFMNLPTEEVAKLVREAGPQVCVFPINGTRRWFMLEHGHTIEGNSAHAYLDAISKRHVEIYDLCFRHGLDTLLTPIFGGELLHRGTEYANLAAEGIARVANDPIFLSFYRENEVNVRFYGNYRKQFAGTQFEYLCNMFDQISESTSHNNRCRLFYGVCANDATETIGELSIQHFKETGTGLSRRQLVERYYGEHVDPVTIFIGFDKLSVFDYPLLNLGEENLYFTMAPSLYLGKEQLCDILYDHVFLRRVEEEDYGKMSNEDLSTMRNFYRANQKNTIGIGKLLGGIWYPSTEGTSLQENKQG